MKRYLVQSLKSFEQGRILAQPKDVLTDMNGSGGATQRAEFACEAYNDDQVILEVRVVKTIKSRKRIK